MQGGEEEGMITYCNSPKKLYSPSSTEQKMDIQLSSYGLWQIWKFNPDMFVLMHPTRVHWAPIVWQVLFSAQGNKTASFLPSQTCILGQGTCNIEINKSITLSNRDGINLRWYEGDQMPRGNTTQEISLWEGDIWVEAWVMRRNELFPIAQKEHSSESGTIWCKDPVTSKNRKTKGMSLDFKSNGKSLQGPEHVGKIPWFVIWSPHSHCCVEYGLQRIKSGSWFKPWFPALYSFLPMICFLQTVW